MNYKIDARPFPTTTLELKQYIRDELREASQEQSSRINRLEHLLKSFVDFVERPTIAGNTLQDIQNYALALCKTARDVLMEEA